MASTSDEQGIDALVAHLLEQSSLRFTIASDVRDATAAYRLRADAVRAARWHDESDDLERDEFDELALHVIGWDGGVAVACGRIVLPPGPLPTELACGIVVEPAAEVADVGRMVVAPSHQDHRHTTFVALLANLYLEVRRRDIAVACGMMSPRVRVVARHLGIHLDVIGDDRPYWGEPRAPVRFSVAASAPSLRQRWTKPT